MITALWFSIWLVGAMAFYSISAETHDEDFYVVLALLWPFAILGVGFIFILIVVGGFVDAVWTVFKHLLRREAAK